LALKVVIIENNFQDALRLMRLSKSVREKDGVRKAVSVMATDKAKYALRDAGLMTDDIERAGPSDLVIAVDAESEEIAEQALSEMESAVSAGGPSGARKARDILNGEMRVINIGLDIFGDALREQSVPVVQVDWEVPAKGDEKIISILKKMY